MADVNVTEHETRSWFAKFTELRWGPQSLPVCVRSTEYWSAWSIAQHPLPVLMCKHMTAWGPHPWQSAKAPLYERRGRHRGTALYKLSSGGHVRWESNFRLTWRCRKWSSHAAASLHGSALAITSHLEHRQTQRWPFPTARISAGD